MDCKEYLAQFSEFLDGRTEAGVSREIHDHRSTCEGCRRYSETLEAGRELLRSLPDLEMSADFRPRLDHRIFHMEDGPSIARQSSGSRASFFSVLAVAALVTVSAWAPGMDRPDPSVDLPAVVVAAPNPPSFTPAPSRPTFRGNFSLFSTTEFQEGIWGDSHDLLREYSPILDRRRNPAFVRVGIE